MGDSPRSTEDVRGGDCGGAAITSRIGRVRFEDAAKDLVTDYRVNG
jgi:hypothetical protein